MSTEMLDLEPIKRLSKDLKAAAATLTVEEVRYLVDLYYQIQDFRIQAASEVRAMEESKEPATLVEWVFENQRRIENSIKGALDVYTDHEPTGMGLWAKNIVGIAEVLSAGFLAHISMQPWKCAHNIKKGDKSCNAKKPHGPECHTITINTVGQIWRFAGMDPTSHWEKGTKRPWNAKLKVLCWKAGESFYKVQNNPKDVYGHLIAQRKELETSRNYAGEFSDQARAILAAKNFSKDTESYQWYSGCLTLESAKLLRHDLAQLEPIDANLKGDAKKKAKREFDKKRRAIFAQYCGKPGSGVPMLPPAHIHARACRWGVKIFLYHWFAEAFRRKWNKEPPMPYVIEHLGHVDLIKP